jgi:hypothetical protein
MPYPIRTCVVCSEEFELKPDKPGFANRCPDCSANEDSERELQHRAAAGETTDREANAARRKAIRDLLYSKDS